jgi:hypothetical protein
VDFALLRKKSDVSVGSKHSFIKSKPIEQNQPKGGREKKDDNAQAKKDYVKEKDDRQHGEKDVLKEIRGSLAKKREDIGTIPETVKITAASPISKRKRSESMESLISAKEPPRKNIMLAPVKKSPGILSTTTSTPNTVHSSTEYWSAKGRRFKKIADEIMNEKGQLTYDAESTVHFCAAIICYQSAFLSRAQKKLELAHVTVSLI